MHFPSFNKSYFVENMTEDEIAQFLGVAGFGHGFEEDDKKLPAVQQNLDKEFVNNYSVKQRYARFMYLFQDEQLDDLPMAKKNGTTNSTTSAISKFDKWFCSIPNSYYNNPSKAKLMSVIENMLRMDMTLPPFIRVCQLQEQDRGVILAHFTHEADKVNNHNLKANSRGLLMTAFQRAFRLFDSKNNLLTASSMTTWKKNPAYKEVHKQCLIQLAKDATVPLAAITGNNKKAAEQMDLSTYRKFLDYIVQKQNENFGSNLSNYCYYLNAEFAAKTLVFGGPRGCTELANMSVRWFVQLESNLLHFLQSAITKGNQTGGDSNFSVKIKPDLYFLGKEMVHHFNIFSQKRRKNMDGTFVSDRLFLLPLPSATFQHDEWFGNVHVGKNNINYVSYIADEMKAEGLLPTFLKLDNTSLRKLRTQALTDAGIQDWMIAETMGQKDKNFQNLGYYRKMDHDDKIKMAHVLANPWKYQKKTFVDEINLFEGFDQENIPPVPLKKPRPTVQIHHQQEETNVLDEVQKSVILNNCSHIVMNVYLGKDQK